MILKLKYRSYCKLKVTVFGLVGLGLGCVIWAFKH